MKKIKTSPIANIAAMLSLCRGGSLVNIGSVLTHGDSSQQSPTRRLLPWARDNLLFCMPRISQLSLEAVRRITHLAALPRLRSRQAPQSTPSRGTAATRSLERIAAASETAPAMSLDFVVRLRIANRRRREVRKQSPHPPARDCCPARRQSRTPHTLFR